MDQPIEIDESQKGIEAHAVKPPATGMKPLPEEKRSSFMQDLEQRRKDEARQKEAVKAAKPDIDKINKALKEERAEYLASPRDKESRDRYREVSNQLKEYRNQIFERTRTERVPEPNARHIPQGVLDDNQKRLIFPRMEEGNAQGAASDTTYPFQLYLETINNITTLKIIKGTVSLGIEPANINTATLSLDPTLLNVGDYVYYYIAFSNSFAVVGNAYAYGNTGPWSNKTKFLKVNATDPYKPYQEYVFIPIAKVKPYTDGGPVYDLILTEFTENADGTQLAQLVKEDIRLELWTVDGLPMWIPNPGVKFDVAL